MNIIFTKNLTTAELDSWKDAQKKADKKEERQKKVTEKKEEKKKLMEEKKTKKKDPKDPQNAKSAYIFYVNELRGKLKIEQPALSVTEVAKEAGRRWKQLSSSAKVKYEKMAADDKLRYEREKHNFDGVVKKGQDDGSDLIDNDEQHEQTVVR